MSNVNRYWIFPDNSILHAQNEALEWLMMNLVVELAPGTSTDNRTSVLFYPRCKFACIPLDTDCLFIYICFTNICSKYKSQFLFQLPNSLSFISPIFFLNSHQFYIMASTNTSFFHSFVHSSLEFTDAPTSLFEIITMTIYPSNQKVYPAIIFLGFPCKKGLYVSHLG